MPKISKKSQERQGPKSQKAMARETKYFFIIVAVVAATILIQLVVQLGLFWQNRSRLAEELQIHKAVRVLTLYEDAQVYQQELVIAKNAATEQLAVKKRQAEMDRRRTRDAAFAVSPREKAMMQMKGMAPAAGEAPEEFLKKLVKLACPPKSGVGISPGKTGYIVEVAFPYSRVTEANTEYKSFLPGYYLEVRKTAAGIAQDVLVYGAALGIEQVIVRCQNVANVQTKDGVKKEKRDLFGIVIVNDGRDWSQYSRAEMEQLWNIKTNQFLGMIANMGATP